MVGDDWYIKQRLVQIKLLTKSLCGDELAREIINILSISFSIRPSNLIAVVRDGASVKGSAMRTVKVVYPELVDITCFSHMLNRVVEHFVTPNLSEFTTSWISLFYHSLKTKLLWKTQTGKAMASYSSTRWWSKWEVQKQIFDYFGDIEGFLRNNIQASPFLRQELMSAAKERQTPINHLLSNHTFANCLIWKTSVNCVSDLSRCDKCLLKF